MISSIVTGAIIGLIAGSVTSSSDRRGCLGSIILGLAGSWIGDVLFGSWGPQLGDMSVIPAVLGAILLIALFGGSGK